MESLVTVVLVPCLPTFSTTLLPAHPTSNPITALFCATAFGVRIDLSSALPSYPINNTLYYVSIGLCTLDNSKNNPGLGHHTSCSDWAAPLGTWMRECHLLLVLFCPLNIYV